MADKPGYNTDTVIDSLKKSKVAKTDYNPDTAIPSLTGKVILVTGGTNGIGEVSVANLARHNPSHIFFTGRNAKSASSITSAAKSVAGPSTKVSFLECDFTDLSSVQSAARKFASQESRLDVLMCNAGIMAVAPALTKQGYEIQFGVNHVAHALLIKLLFPTLEKTAGSRIVNLTSLGYMLSPESGIAFDQIKTTQDVGPGGEWMRYGQSKLANIVYAAALADRYPDITSVAVHPGAVDTDLVGNLNPEQKALVYDFNPQLLTREEGAHSQLWAATVEKAKLSSGTFYVPVGQEGPRDEKSQDKALQKRLWEWSQEELKGWNL